MAKINWRKIETEYITTDISQRDLAKKYKVPLPTIVSRSKANNWYEQKKQNHSKIIAESIEKSNVETVAEICAELNVANKLIKLLEEATEDDTFKAHNGFGEEIENSKDTKKINEAAAALSKLNAMKRVISGEYNKKEADALELARRKLEIEERKANADLNTDKEIKIVIDDSVKDYIV